MFNKKGNGYDGFSMSNNARLAYENNEMPKSKWTKKAIIELLERERPDYVSIAKNLPAYVLKEYLKKTSWHHTGKLFNKIDFYSFDIEKFTHARFEDFYMIEAQYKKTKENNSKTERWLIAYTEWEKSSRFGRPKPVEYCKQGTIDGNIFIADDGTRKMVSGKSFKKIKRLS